MSDQRWTTRCRTRVSGSFYNPTPADILSPSLWQFPVCAEDKLNKKTFKHTRREMCVDSEGLFLCCQVYVDWSCPSKVSLRSCFAHFQKVRYSTGTDFLNQRPYAALTWFFFFMIYLVLLRFFAQMSKWTWEQDTVFLTTMQKQYHVPIKQTTSVENKKICSLKIYILLVPLHCKIGFLWCNLRSWFVTESP